MKILKTSALCVFLSVCSLVSFSQTNDRVPLNEPNHNKPKLFADLPQRTSINVGALEALFNYDENRQVQFNLAPGFNFVGTIVSKASYENATSVVIKSTNRQGASFTFTKTISDDGEVTFLGRIFSRQHGDAFDIVKENGGYVLQKKGFYDLIAE